MEWFFNKMERNSTREGFKQLRINFLPVKKINPVWLTDGCQFNQKARTFTKASDFMPPKNYTNNNFIVKQFS